MSDLQRRVGSLSGQLAPDWTDERERRVEASLLRRRRRRQLRRGFGVVLTAIALGWGALHLPGLLVRQPAPVASTGASTGTIQFADGSIGQPLDGASELQAILAEPGRATVAVVRGGGQFSVTRDPARLFRVVAGDVTVEVVGTRFTVERLATRARVTVDEGRVRVLWPSGTRELGAGESDLFPPPAVPPPAPPATAPVIPEAPAPPRRPPLTRPTAVAPTPTKAPGWRKLAQDGEYDRAFAAFAAEGPPSDEPADLLLAADVARLSHHPAQAVAPLERVVTRHAADPRAPLAAFTLGRVLLEDLGQPRQAASAFALARSLDHDGPLAEDALAREVEAASRAGDAARARTLAEEFITRYPDGRRLRSVRRHGGLE